MSYAMSDLCSICGKHYGAHAHKDNACPTSTFGGYSRVDRFLLATPATITTGVTGAPRCPHHGIYSGRQCIKEIAHLGQHDYLESDLAAHTGGDTMTVVPDAVGVPAKMKPQWEIKELIDTDAAMKAVRDMSRGSQ